MSDIYQSKLAKFVAFLNRSSTGRYAVTTSATCTRYEEQEATVSLTHRKHEDKHKQQIKEEGWLKFMFKYFFFLMIRGYQNNPYEIEARLAENQ